MKKYYFEVGVFNDICTERCKFKDDGTMIGSVVCQRCEFCEEHQEPCRYTGTVYWIKCSRLKEATKEEEE